MKLVSSNKSGSNKKQQQQQCKEKTQTHTPRLAFLAPGPAPIFENNGKIRDSDWLQKIIPRGTIEKFSHFFLNAVDHVWAAQAS